MPLEAFISVQSSRLRDRGFVHISFALTMHLSYPAGRVSDDGRVQTRGSVTKSTYPELIFLGQNGSGNGKVNNIAFEISL